jgi:hypothetical protein
MKMRLMLILVHERSVFGYICVSMLHVLLASGLVLLSPFSHPRLE